MRRVCLSVSVIAAVAVSLTATQSTDTPEAAIRQLLRAMYAKDVAAFNRVTVEHPLRARLTAGGGGVNQDGLRRLDQDPDSLQTRELRPMLYRGKVVDAPARAAVGSTALYMAAHQNSPLAVPLVKTADGWKVDVRWWIATTQMADGSAKPTPPEIAIRSLLQASLRLDRARAAGFLTDPRTAELLFFAAPREREPSGVLEEAAAEMPLVEIGAGEFYPLPVDRVVEGGSTEDRKVFVGMAGPIELPFVVRRIKNEWKVEAAPYPAMMNQ